MNDPRTVSASVGAAVPHDSAEGHVSGTAVYVDDLALPVGTLHVATGFADIACGRLESLDLDAVRGAAGVRDVIVAADVPGELDIGAVFPGDPLLADGSIRYHGQPLFAVAAESLRLAQQAVRLAHISVESEAAPLNVAESLAAGAFVLPSRTWEYHDDSDRDPAAVQVEGEMYLRGQEHFYLEGQAALALPGEDDTMVVVSSTQHPDEVQHQVAAVLGIAMHKVRVQCRRMGGGFGGKETQAAPLACLAALLARRTGRAVKYRMPRHDDMIQTGKRHDFAASFCLEADADGHIRHYDVILAGKCGHSPDLSDGIVDRAMFHALNAYYAPSARITGHRCRTATVSNTAFRGFGGPQGMVVIEAAMDELAFATGIDRLELRKRNLYAPGRDVTPYGQTVKQHVLADIIADLETRCDYRARQEAARAFNAAHRHFKKGLALTPVQFGISFTAIHLNQAGALLHVYRDGSVGLSHGGTEMGQGLYVKVRQVVARSLGLPLQRIELSGAETDKVPNASATAASSGSDLNGMAALAACRTIKARLAEFLRAELNWPGAPIQFADGEIRCGDQSLTFAEAAAAAHRARISLSATGFYRTPDIHFDKDAGKGQPFFYYANGAAASEVAIDTLTGEYRLLRTDIVHDVGDSLNPAVDLGQIEGGFVQGLGWLTTEELLWNDEGRLISDSPANYKIPTAHDCPEILNVTLYDGANPEPTLFRSKAVGEPPLMLAISAWCALRDACSAAGDYRTLAPLAVPATPEAVFHAVQAVGGGR